MALDDLIIKEKLGFFGKLRFYTSVFLAGVLSTLGCDGEGNKAPIISNLSDVVVNELELVKLNPIVTDPEGGPVAITYSPPLDSTGEWTPTYDDDGIHNVTVTAEDEAGNKAYKNVEITVNDVNRVPDLFPIADIVVNENDLIQVVLNAFDPDTNNILVYSIPGFVKTGDKTFEKQTTYIDSGIYIVTATVDDQRGGIDHEDFEVTINDVNRPPFFTNLPITANPSAVRENNTVTVFLYSDDLDLDTVVKTIEPAGKFQQITNDEFRWIPDYSTTNLPSQVFNFTAKIDDGKPGGVVTAPFSVTVYDSKIAFQRLIAGFYDIIIKNPDGSGVEQNITNTANVNETNPQFFPDGTKIFCISDDTGNREVYTIDLTTFVKTKISDDPGLKSAKIGPNQQYFYFVRGNRIWRRNIGGGNLTDVNQESSCTSYTYDLSPNGDRLIYGTQRYLGSLLIAEINLVTLIATQLTAAIGEAEWHPTYHPFDQRFAFQSTRAAGRQIFVGDLPNGANITDVSQNTNFNEFPTFSLPNGAYVFYKLGNNIERVNYPLGGGKIPVTTSNDIVGKILCIPNKIIYMKDFGGGNINLFDADQDGSNERRLTNNSTEDINPTYK